MSRSNFQRSQSRVFYGNAVPDNPFYAGVFGTGGGHYFHSAYNNNAQRPAMRPALQSNFQELDEEEELSLERTPEKQTSSAASNSSNGRTVVGWNDANRQGSPASHKSQVRWLRLDHYRI